MSAQDATLAFVVGVVIRFAIPIGLTLVAIWFFRKLDQRWKAEAEELTRMQMAMATAKRTPCWEQKQCSPEKMRQLPCVRAERSTLLASDARQKRQLEAGLSGLRRIPQRATARTEL